MFLTSLGICSGTSEDYRVCPSRWCGRWCHEGLVSLVRPTLPPPVRPSPPSPVRPSPPPPAQLVPTSRPPHCLRQPPCLHCWLVSQVAVRIEKLGHRRRSNIRKDWTCSPATKYISYFLKSQESERVREQKLVKQICYKLSRSGAASLVNGIS